MDEKLVVLELQCCGVEDLDESHLEWAVCLLWRFLLWYEFLVVVVVVMVIGIVKLSLVMIGSQSKL